MTQRELAAAAGCSLSWIANAEGGYIPRQSPTLERVLAVLRNKEAPAPDPTATGTASP